MREYIEKTIDFYDQYVDEYIKTDSTQDIKWLDTFASHFQEGAKILDLGCAYGRDCEYFLKKNFDTYGVDLSAKMIDRAKTRVEGASFTVMDALDLKYEDTFFDGIWCSATLIHISKSDISTSLKEIYRILKSGGILYLNLKEGEGERYVQDPRYDYEEKFYSFFTVQEIKDFLNFHHFQIRECEVEHYDQDYKKGGIIYIIAQKE